MISNFVFLKAILLVHTVGLVAGFIPTSPRLFAADLLLPNNGQSFTHSDLTRGGMLEITARVLMDNPANQNSTRDIQELISSRKITVSCLIDAYYGRSEELAAVRSRQKEQLERAIDTVNDFQARTDTDEVENSAAHFDSEQFADGQARLVDFRQIVVQEIMKGDHGAARRFMGRLLHTLQDFYSHSNWIEIFDSQGDDSPSPNAALGQSGMSVGNTADPTRPTCTDCERTGSIPLARLLNLASFIGSVACYNCRGNVDNSVISERVLTSGYYDGGRDSQNREIVKPNGKCSHGGVLDRSQDSPARGGINKDSTHDKLAPHYYLHARAATTAQQHTLDMFANIREDVNNDELFSAFLGLEVEVNRFVSLAMVIDTTRRSNDELQEIVDLIPQIKMDVQQYINTFENDLQVRYILVPVEDSGMVHGVINVLCFNVYMTYLRTGSQL